MKRNTITTVGLCIASATIAFVATLVAAPDPISLDRSELGISSEDWSRVQSSDPTFKSESRDLAARLDRQRTELADLLDNPATTDAAILEQVDAVIATHDQLERRIAQHLVEIRHQLTADQQKRLMGIASANVRHGGYRWRGGRSPEATSVPQDHPGRHGKGRDQ